MRIITLDTETTGLDPKSEKIVEIACLEVNALDAKKNRSFVKQINPQKAVGDSYAIHGLDDHFLSSQPLFTDIVEDFIKFIEGAEIVIHNADFDCKFLDQALAECGKKTLKEYAGKIVDTLKIARARFPGKRATLDSLAQRFGLEKKRQREGGTEGMHSALADVMLLAEVYQALQRGQQSMVLRAEEDTTKIAHASDSIFFSASDEEKAEHEAFLQKLADTSKNKVLWSSS